MAATFPMPKHIALPQNVLTFPSFDYQSPMGTPAGEHGPTSATTFDVEGDELLKELKALLQLHRVERGGSVEHFTFTPTRAVTWKGDVVAYKIRPLLADEQGCLTIRMSPKQVNAVLTSAAQDEDLVVTTTKRSTHLFNAPANPVYKLSLAHGSPDISPTHTPKRSLHNLSAPGTPQIERIEPDWMENEGWKVDSEGNLVAVVKKLVTVIKLNDK